jgi:16S rRNA (adenine1518-N6/adenine1519-N6)-dimethyltransferase
MKADINKLIDGEESVKVVANLPYYITTPIIMKLLEGHYNIKSITVMIQKEVAERFVAKEGTKDYGAITLSINYYTNPKITLTVPPSAFIPPPKVHSSVITLECKEPDVDVKEPEKMFKIIKSAFNQRRKTLVNALSSNLSNYSKEHIKETIISLGHNESVRGETLSLKEFAEISNNL